MTDDSFVGQSLKGRYQVQALIGRGGMASVYRAYDANLHRAVAVKIIHPYFADNPDFIRRFEDEATLVAQFHQPNIPVVYDFDHEGDLCYIVMEYIEGETLEYRLKNLAGGGQRLPVNVAVQYITELCQSAGYAHQHGVVHRDIKPANVIIDLNDKVNLMDFGIARIVGGQKHTATGIMVGTAHYMAPEQIQGLMLDARADIYALGATFFEMLSGRPPFEADSAMTVMMMHLNDPLPDIHELRPDVSPAIGAVIAKAMAKNREQRFPTAVDMSSALRRALEQPTAPMPTARQAEPEAFEATFIEGPAAFKVMSTAREAGERQTKPAALPTVKTFPQTPEESLYPVSPKRGKAWMILVGILVIGLLLGGAYYLLGLKPAQTSRPDPDMGAGYPTVEVASVTPLLTQPGAVTSPDREQIQGPAATSPVGQPTEIIAPTTTDEPTETAAPTATETAQPSNSGFANNCIDANIWTPYKLQGITEENGCWNLTHWGMAAENGVLSIHMDRMLNESERSIHRSLDQSAVVRLRVRVDELQTLSNFSGGLAFGVGKPDTWQEAGRYIVFRRSASLPGMQIYLSNGVNSQGVYYQDAELNVEYDLEIHYGNGEVAFYLNGIELDVPYALPASIAATPVFSIGYALPSDGRIQAVVLELNVEER